MSGALCHYGMAGEEQARLERSKRDCCAEHGIDRAGAGEDPAESGLPANTSPLAPPSSPSLAFLPCSFSRTQSVIGARPPSYSPSAGLAPQLASSWHRSPAPPGLGGPHARASGA